MFDDSEGNTRIGITAVTVTNGNQALRVRKCSEGDKDSSNRFIAEEQDYADVRASQVMLFNKA